MTSTGDRQDRLKHLPGVDLMLRRAQSLPHFREIPRAILVEAIRETLDEIRAGILSLDSTTDEDSLDEGRLMEALSKTLERSLTPNLRRLVNATGVVIHTNLGRSLLAEAALTHLNTVAASYSNLEKSINVPLPRSSMTGM